MVLTERQKRILSGAVAEHIATAVPVSSQQLEEAYDFGVSPATIRAELGELSGQGYLVQPHASAGRVPTDKGYRFYVDGIRNATHARVPSSSFAELFGEADDLELLSRLTARLAGLSSALTLGYLAERRLLWKEGWELLLAEPEFSESSVVRNLARFLRDLEEHLDGVVLESSLQVYIGRENPFSRVADFSIILCAYEVQGREKGLAAIVGPKRMPYPRNLRLIASLRH